MLTSQQALEVQPPSQSQQALDIKPPSQQELDVKPPSQQALNIETPSQQAVDVQPAAQPSGEMKKPSETISNISLNPSLLDMKPAGPQALDDQNTDVNWDTASLPPPSPL